jgi:hypothetical protein
MTGPSSGPGDPARRAEWRRAQRRVALAHHPDRGGDLDDYLARLTAVDRAFGVTPGPGPVPEVRPTRTRRAARLLKTLRGQRRWPRTRRYIEL